jgi:hypothetical protein
MNYSICQETGLRVCEVYPFLLVREDGMVKNIGGHPLANKDWNSGNFNSGYSQIGIPNLKKCRQVHHLVAIAFIPNNLDRTFIDHIDGNKRNNNIDNLRWVTRRENNQNKLKHRHGHLCGTSFSKENKRWRSSIQIGKIKKHLGYFDTQIEAHLKYKDYLNNLE